MNILINASNLTKGGGLQVAHSFINELKFYLMYNFTIVVSNELNEQIKKSEFPENFIFVVYSLRPSFFKAIFGCDIFLNNLEAQIKPDRVFTVFGPGYWKPKTKHIVGFAKPQYIYKESPFFQSLSIRDKYLLVLKKMLHLYNFKITSNVLITETSDVTSKVQFLFPSKKVFTVSNNYNQIFDNAEDWDRSVKLPNFNGITLLTITANYSHKNLKIIPEVISVLNNNYPNFKYRFVLSITDKDLNISDDKIKNKIILIGKVTITQCPYLYQQSDFMFLPTLLECFTASYPEAMKMEKPILTSNLSFSKDLCGSAAKYFNPMCAKDIAETIFSLAINKKEQESLVRSGLHQLLKFDSARARVEKSIKIIKD